MPPTDEAYQNSLQLREMVRSWAHEAGFVRAGFTKPWPLLRGRDALGRWLDQGMHGEMGYMAEHGGAEGRSDPSVLLPSARIALVVVARYADGADDPPIGSGQGRIARYARGEDYHRVVRRRLYEVIGRLAEWTDDGEVPPHRVCVDSAPLLERELAERAGVGFIGKNTMLISPGVGAYTVLGVALLGVELPPDEPMEPRCGSCDLCLRACPTEALREPYVLDARRCISYLTIEHRGEIAAELAAQHGEWVFGCDDCNHVCPFNKPTPQSKELAPDPDLSAPAGRGVVELAELAELRSGQYRRLVRGRALSRAPRQSFQRNARIALQREQRD